ncbi:MAG: D-tyrosyl-tRNA(Tyr) deacylase [Ignavibacteria bacterium]|nr:D-tyrosyl-tRNA(Tyr) deacylase [Ignavibacteria bacterium]MCU7504038.1 D-tyrosyl-tRNA(Tyr) deacylase [Ignavibacteria bacterium]MCU7515410.1 D-tyrosyl-tRNA(Tyr) deacylase [Ignavibacteria bacterium]
MRALVQRVSEGGVFIKSRNYSAEISKGMVILLGVRVADTEQDVTFVADKCSNLRIFEDGEGKMNLSIKDVGGEALIISQFTLYGDARKGNRPNFTEVARAEQAEDLYNKFVERVKANLGDARVKTGIFQAMMEVKIINDGPVTILVESKQ